MKIQKGIVKYKDRNDIVCTYGVTEDGRQYYFLDETDSKKLANGNRIATTALVEAIDPMVKASNVGVIDNDGNVIVMFDNRTIKPINDEIILLEKAEPVSQSVIEANTLRSDPLSATKLVSTPATIKDRLNATMGGEGRYVFNDQFSEATLCDINGNNLVNGELYSFIAMTNDKIYLSKNTADSVINELPINSNINVQDNVNIAEALDVGNTVVDQSIVENALSNTDIVAQEGAVVADALASEEVVGLENAVTGEAVAEVATENVVEDVMPYNDDISTVFEENNTPVSEVSDSAGFDLPEEPIPYDDNLSTIVPEAPGVPALGEENPVENVVEEVMPYDDNLSTIVASSDVPVVPALGEEVPVENVVEEVMPYNEDISTIVASSDVSANDIVEEPIPYDDNLSTIVPEDVVNNNVNDSTGFDLPKDLVVNDEEVFMPPVVEEEEPVQEEAVIPEVSAEEVASTVVSEEVKEDTVIDVFNEKEENEEAIPFDSEVVSDNKSVEEQVVNEVSQEVEEEVVNTPIEETQEVSFSSDLYSNNNENNEELSDDYSYPSNYQSDVPGYGDFIDNYSKPLDLSYSDSYYDRKQVEDYSSEKYSIPTNQYPRYDSYDSVFKSSMIKPDRIVPTNDYYDSYSVDYIKSNSTDNNSIMSDVARSMTELMRQNKEQKGAIIQYQEKLDAVESQRRLLSEKYNDQTLRVETLSNKLRTLDDASTRLESKNQLLESRIRDQEKIIAAQERELKSLRPQLEGRQDLIKILADAKALLGTDDDYQDDPYYGRRVA